ncbi:MAG: tRNA (guanosine(37)-N1)-methyltransferase TrmD [Desulfobacterales bacterium]|nr:tRNA (guanosine(37)-N1)-methyltransferase TrmD [Desulfobacterales bacterium]
MDFTVLTLFPEFLDAFFANGMIGRAMEQELITGGCINIRDFTTDRHHTVDDRPYGGGSGMVMKPEPLFDAIEAAKAKSPNSRVVLMTPQGRRFNQQMAEDFAQGDTSGLIFICGRYEGIDERVYERHVDEEISIGDYVMTGGELAAMTIIDSVSRLLPGVLGSFESSQSDSFSDDRLEYAQYTRPEVFEDMAVPDVLLSGNHGKIDQWRKYSSLKRTFLKRPDLFTQRTPDPEEKKILRQWCDELEALIHG